MPYKSPDQKRQYQSKWIAKRKEKFFAPLSCEKCGTSDNLGLSSNVPGVRIRAMSPWNNPDVPRENYKVLCSDCKPKPKPRKPRKRTRTKKISEARKMAIQAQRMLRQRRKNNATRKN